MKKVIVRFDYHNLRNEVHVEFNSTLDALFIKFNPETLGIAVLYAVFKALLTEEVVALDVILRSKITEIIDRLDRERDSYWRGFEDHVKADLHHFNPDRRESAHQLMVILEHYGDIAHRSLDAETAAIEDLHTELLKPDNFVHVAALGLGEWLGNLVQTSRNLDEQMKMRYEEAGKRPDLHMRGIRKQLDRTDRDIFDRIESLVNVNGEADYKDFLHELNAVMTRYKDLLAQEAGRRRHVKDLGEGDHTVIEPIDTQKYTERPITVIPKVHYREEGKPTLNLSLGKDFDVTFKNNTDVGMAEVTVHGKGDYKGEKTTTFMIAR
ncbi:MAG: DUF6261 family protein [Prevotellaceae bacterium]|jgi:hypothetical protein|nr:DUF6261 family protein [Prevotellaceae bacterium]